MANTIGLQLKVDTKEVKNADGVIDDFTESVMGADNAVDDLGDELTKTGKKAKNAGKDFKTAGSESKKTAGAFQLQKNASQQLGFQLQDVAVQAQMGVSPFTILGQQGSQLAGVFGSGGALFGAVIAIGAAVGGVLVKAFGNASMSAEELTERIHDTAKSFIDLTESQKQYLADLESATIDEKREELANLTKQLEQTQKQFDRAYESGQRFNEGLDSAGASQRRNARYKASAEAANELAKEITFLEAAIDTVNKELNISTEEVDKLTGGLVLLKNQSDIDIAVTLQGNDIASLEADRARLTAINEQSVKDYQMSLFNAFEEERKQIEQNNKLKEQQVATQNKLFEIQVENARKSLLTQEELQNEYYRNSLVSLDEYAENKNLTLQEKQEIEEQLTAAHLAKLESLEEKSNIKRSTSFVDSINMIETAFGAIDDLTQASTLSRQKSLDDDLRNSQNFTAAQIANKEKEAMRLFELQKNASLNSIIASTSVGVMTQLATGNWGGAFAVGAAGARNYAKVANTSYSSPAGAPSSAGTAPPSQNTTNNNNGGNITNVTINGTNTTGLTEEGLVQLFKDGFVAFDSDTEQGALL